MGRKIVTEKLSEESKEIAEYLSSQTRRMNNLYCVEPERGGIVKFKMNPVQKLYWKAMWWLNVILKSRQHGMSTVIVLHMGDTCMFNENVTCGIIDKTMDDAKKKLAKVKLCYEHMDNKEVHPDTWQLGSLIKKTIRIVKSNDTEIEFSNGSKIWAGVSLRGGTVQYLHVSELGPIAYKDARKAEEIRSGAFNTIHKNCKIVIESTHEGGKFGLNYEMIRLAQQSPEKLSPMHWKFHFFGWWQDPKNYMEPDSGYDLTVTPDFEKLFVKKEKQLGMKLTKGQKYWYALKKAVQKDAMAKEHPFDAEEALDAAIKGAIYGMEIAEMRDKRRIIDFEIDGSAPIFTFWDLGKSDFTTITLMQFVGRDWLIVDHFAYRGRDEKFYYAKIMEWERKYGMISRHFLPHDAANDNGPGGSWQQAFMECGMKNISIVPVTPDKWLGIRHMRSLLPQCFIHYTNCSVEFDTGDMICPSLIASFEGYHVKMEESSGVLKEVPNHDETSHSMDSIRTFAEAHKLNMLDDPSKFSREGRRRGNLVDKGRYADRAGNRVRVSKGSNVGRSNLVRY